MIKDLNTQLEEYKNQINDISEENKNINNNVNEKYEYKKLISVMNIGETNENQENEKIGKVSDLRKPSINERDQRFPTARFGGEFNNK